MCAYPAHFLPSPGLIKQFIFIYDLICLATGHKPFPLKSIVPSPIFSHSTRKEAVTQLTSPHCVHALKPKKWLHNKTCRHNNNNTFSFLALKAGGPADVSILKMYFMRSVRPSV